MSSSDPIPGSRFLVADLKGPREEQQDAAICFYDEAQGTGFIVVGDGVGGKSGGRIASQKVKALAAEVWAARKGHFANPGEELETLCRVAHERINEEGAKRGISPRTTIVALYLDATHAYWVHSGDSRLYHFRSGRLIERTEDHTFLELMVQKGAVKEQDMGSHPDQNTLLQSLGGFEYSTPSTGAAEITPDDGFLLCTDGFWERTKPEEMAELLGASSAQAAEALSQAVSRAVERNGPKGDNVTVALALPARKSSPAGRAGSVGHPKGSRRLLMVALVLLVVALVFLFWPQRKSEPPAPMPSPAAVPSAPSDSH